MWAVSGDVFIMEIFVELQNLLSGMDRKGEKKKLARRGSFGIFRHIFMGQFCGHAYDEWLRKIS